MKTIKIFLTENDGNDIVAELSKNQVGLYDTHETFDEKGNKILVEIHLKKCKLM